MKRMIGLGLYLRHSKPGCACSSLSALIFIVVFLFLYNTAVAQAPQEMDYTIQANIIYRFTKYIDWPEYKKSGDFVIGIVGESPLADELKAFTINKTAGSQRIVIKRFSSSEQSYNCHILFVGEDESGSLKKIALRTAGSAILIVSESEGLALKGACINFIIVSDQLKLQINRTNLERRSLGIASELLRLGISVR